MEIIYCIYTVYIYCVYIYCIYILYLLYILYIGPLSLSLSLRITNDNVFLQAPKVMTPKTKRNCLGSQPHVVLSNAAGKSSTASKRSPLPTLLSFVRYRIRMATFDLMFRPPFQIADGVGTSISAVL